MEHVIAWEVFENMIWWFLKPYASSESSIGDQGWRSGESTRLPPIWPVFLFPVLTPYVSWVCRNCCFSSLLVGFFSGYSGFPPPTKKQDSQIPIQPGNIGRETHSVEANEYSHLLVLGYFITQRLFCNFQLVICINSLTKNRKHRKQKIRRK